MEDKPKTHRIWALETNFQGPNFSSKVIRKFLSIFPESPLLLPFAEDNLVIRKSLDFQAYVTEGLEAEGIFHDGGVSRRTIDGEALYEEAVAFMPELPIHLTLRDGAEQGQRPRETDILRVRIRQTPLTEQVASLPAFLTRSKQEERK